MTQSNITVDQTSAALGSPDIARTLLLSMVSLHNNGDKKIYIGLDVEAVAGEGIVIMPGESKTITKGTPTFGVSLSFQSIPDMYFICNTGETSNLAVRYL